MVDKVIQLQDISFCYRHGNRVLDGLNFTLRQGERIGFFGPNGCGKTTIFHLIMGLIKPASGIIKVFGRQVSEEKDFRPVREKIGFLFQNSDDQLFCPTVLEDVAFGPLNLGKKPKEVREIVRETLATLGISNLESRISYQLSHGEKKLVALATMMAMQPEVLILDEPTAGLDTAAAEWIVEILNKLNLTSIVTSHDMAFLTKITEKIYGMSEGRISPVDKATLHSHMHVHRGGLHPHTHSDEG